ncbi:MAG: MFS transporter [Candidatus Rokubacteria bacterium]|nr:MFS transporter [Candidatus Rokubacteria bacterium]
MPSPYLVWGLLVYAWVANYMIRMGLSSLLPPIMAELTLSYTRAGLLATAFFYAYMAMQLPAGFLGDRLGRKRVLLGGILLGAVASLGTGLAGSFGALFLARLLTGLSQGCLFSNDRVIIAAYTPKEKMALGQGVSFSGPGLGTTLGLILAGVLGELMPWRAVFFVFALPPLLAAFLLWQRVPEPPSMTVGDTAGWTFRRVAGTRELWILGVAGIMPVYLQFVLATWGPLFFSEVGVTDLGRSALYASFQGVAAPFGLFAMGWLADRCHKRGFSRKVVIALTILLAGVSVGGMGGVVQTKGPAGLVALFMMATSFFVWGTWGPSYALLAERFPPGILGTAFGLYNTVCFLGAVVGPHLTGWIKDVTGSFAWGCYGAAVVAGVGAGVALTFPPAFRLKLRVSVAAREPRQV